MPRFFFDVHDGRDLIDDEGVELCDVGAAKREALKCASGMLGETSADWPGELLRMDVRDERGNVVASLRFTAS